MSVTHRIKCYQPVYTSDLENFLAQNNEISGEHRGGGVYYFYEWGKSSRGMDITILNENVEVRNTVLSNRADYELTNKLVYHLLLSTSGLLFTQEGEHIKSMIPFSDESINELIQRDGELIQQMSREHEDIALDGPIRKVHFGKRTHKQLSRYSKQQLPEKMLQLILHVNYGLPPFEYGNIMQFSKDGTRPKTAKVLTNKTDCIIDKYDCLLLINGKRNPVVITNEILNTILPDTWQLVDEFTVVAPILKQGHWKKLLEKAREFDLHEDFFGSDGI